MRLKGVLLVFVKLEMTKLGKTVQHKLSTSNVNKRGRDAEQTC